MNIKKFGANSKKLVVLGMMFLLFAAGVGYAAFVRTGGNMGFSYGYGYGYGYGYRNDEVRANNADYGFLGTDGKATAVSVNTTRTSFTVTYTTDYLAKNKIQYGLTTAMTSSSSEMAFQSGSNSIVVSGLTCGRTYYYRVVSTDAGDNVWYSTATYSTTATNSCAVSSGGGTYYPTTTPTSTATPTTTPTWSAAVINQMRSLLNQLIAALRALLLQMKSLGYVLSPEAEKFLETPPICSVVSTITKDLTIGSVGAEVKTLQQFLNCYGFPVAVSGPGSSGNETTTFGSLTQGALAKFQASTGISPAAGYFGAKTRAYLKTIGY